MVQRRKGGCNGRVLQVERDAMPPPPQGSRRSVVSTSTWVSHNACTASMPPLASARPMPLAPPPRGVRVV